jgi:hypothetical protein
MSEVASPETLRKLLNLLDPVTKRLGSKPAEVQEGSELNLLDERLGHPHLLSHAVVGALVRADDQLSAIHNLVFKAGVLHPWASMTLARGALENAAVAVWLLGNVDHDERCRRVLRLAAQDLQEQRDFQAKLAETIGREDGRHADLIQQVQGTEEKRRKVLDRAGMLGLGREIVNNQVWWSGLFDTVAKENAPGTLTPHLLWKLLSGLTHGRSYASLVGLDYALHPTGDEQSALVEFTANEEYLYVAVLMTCDLLRRSRRHYERDRLKFTESRPR